jgi:hypothetical protein
MDFLAVCNSSFSLEDLAARIRKSSNFRFEWEFYRFRGIDTRSTTGVRRALDEIIATPDLHRFLQESFVAKYDKRFEIEPIHKHCQVVTASDEFENILASAAGNHLGAYSRVVRAANAAEKEEIKDLFGCVGSYCAFQLVAGNDPSCSACRHHNNHLFSTWFYGVAWDWCLFASWPRHGLFWMGCLTDTD